MAVTEPPESGLVVGAAPAASASLATACGSTGTRFESRAPSSVTRDASVDIVVLDLSVDAADMLRWATSSLPVSAHRVVAIAESPPPMTDVAVHAWVEVDAPLVRLLEVVSTASRPVAVASSSLPVRDRTALTSRQLEVLRTLVITGTAAEAAKLLGISGHTLRTHIQNILGELGVRSRTEAVAWAIRAGLVRAETREGRAP